MAMSDFEHKKRYNQLLNDWKGVSDPATTEEPDVFAIDPSLRRENTRQPTPRATPMPQEPAPVRPPTPFVGGVLFTPGAILSIGQHLMGIYRAAVPERGFHMMLMLNPGGVVRVQGVDLERYEVEEVGVLPPRFFDQLQAQMTWDRDLIVFHCYSYEDTAKVPSMEHHVIHGGEHHPPSAPVHAPAPPPAPEAAPVTHHAPSPRPEHTPEPEPPAAQTHHVHITPPSHNGLHRGQRLQFVVGDKTWQAVYWGKDDAGHVIAHKTYEDWDLMHMDLDRYTSSLNADPEPDPALVKSIEDSLKKT